MRAAGTRNTGRREKIRKSAPDISVIDLPDIVIRLRTFPSMEPGKGNGEVSVSVEVKQSGDETYPYHW